MNLPKAVAKRVLSSVETYRDARIRRPPKFGVHASVEGRESVYYLCPDSNTPSGGIRVIYRHVDLLNSIGIPAAVVHRQRGFSCTWFQHSTAITAAGEINLGPKDILVVPEFYGPYLSELPQGSRIVIFNQNTYQTFPDPRRSVAEWRRSMAWHQVESMLVVSRDNESYARYAFRDLPVHRIRNSLDSDVFYPAADTPRRRLAVMPRRRGKDCTQVLNLLALRGVLEGWEIVRIENRSETETADLLRSCALFLSFSEQEGFGMPPAEAMACGCYVVGFTGLAGREFFYEDLSSPVEEGDVLAFARAAEDAIKRFEADPGAVRELALKASELVRAEYSIQKQLAEVRAFFDAMRGQLPDSR